MLQSIREYTQGWIAGFIISIIILTFALWGVHSYFDRSGSDNVVAAVNGVQISKEQLTVAYERLRRQAQSQQGAVISGKDETNFKSRALQSLIDVEALKQSSFNQGFRISNGQIDNYLQSMPDFQVNGQFSIDRFQQALSSTLMTTSEFLDLIKTSLLIEQPRLGVILTSFALPEETNYTVALVNQERDIDYINIPTQYFTSQSIAISAEKIQAYYEQHKLEFMTPEQVNVEYIQLSLKDLAEKFQPAEAVLKSYYNENINSYTQPMQWKLTNIEITVPANASQEEIAKAQAKANEVMQSLKSGADFTKLARENSQELDGKFWMTLNQVPTDLQKAAAELIKPNQLAGPIKTSKGFVILKAVEIREPKIQPFETVQDKVKEIYIRQKGEEKLAEMRDQLADTTYEHPESLQTAAKTLGLEIKTSESFAKDKAGKDISQYKKVRDIAFSNDVLSLQNNSDVIQLDPETMIVIRVKSHVPSKLLPLGDISKQIEDKLKASRAEEMTAKLAEDLKAKLDAGADPVKLAADNKLTWSKLGYMGRYSTKVDSAILDLAFRLPNISINKNKAVYGVSRSPMGYAIVALKGVKDGAIDDKKQYSVFAEQVQNSEGLLEYELYKESQLGGAKVEK